MPFRSTVRYIRLTSRNNIAVFIDFENIHHSSMNCHSRPPEWGRIVELCRQEGHITSIQAYGDWIEFPAQANEILRHGIQPTYVPLSQHRKSSLDCYLIVAAMRLFFLNDRIETLVLGSGDRDYIPLAVELKAMGKRVVVLAIPGTVSRDLSLIVDGIIEYQPLERTRRPHTRLDATIIDFIRSTIQDLEHHSTDERWVDVLQVGNELVKRQDGFDHQDYGFDTLIDLLSALDTLEIEYEDHEKTHASVRTRLDFNHQFARGLQYGTIINVNNGYGFIRPDQGDKNIFFHFSKVKEDPFSLRQDERVAFRVFRTARGLNADDIERLEHAPPSAPFDDDEVDHELP